MTRLDLQPREAELFREQALQAWRGQEAETRVLLDLSPRWMSWALGGILLMAVLGLALAATTTIPQRATSTASARLNASGDTILVDAVLALPSTAVIRPGEAMSFRPHDPAARELDLSIQSVVPYPGSSSAPSTTSRRVLIRAATPSRGIGDVRTFTGPSAGGTAGIRVGTETLLHLLRPRAPRGSRP